MDYKFNLPVVELAKNQFNKLDFKKSLADSEDSKKLKEACRSFESILLNQMLSTMRKSIPKEGLFKKWAMILWRAKIASVRDKANRAA